MRRLAVAALLALAACRGGSEPGPPDLAFAGAFAAHDQVDLLFVLANFTMLPKVRNLQAHVSTLIDALDAAAPASYHLGLITSDLGAGLVTVGQCHPDGDGARLQVGPAGTSPAVPPSGCQGFGLAGGARYIDYDRRAGTSNVVGAPDVTTAFQCLVSLSDAGCPYLQPLAAAERAVANPPPENAGFVRDDALLAIVFVEDGDDCSARADSALFDPSRDPVVAGSSARTRCAHASIACGSPPAPLDMTMAGGPFDDCVPRTQTDGSPLDDVQRYIDFFARPGGAKPDPSDVILASLSGPPSPFAWTVAPPELSPSCSDGDLSAAPSVRLPAVVGAAYTSTIGSICDHDDAATLAALGQQIAARLR